MLTDFNLIDMDYGHGDGAGVVGRDVTISFTTWIKSVYILMFMLHVQLYLSLIDIDSSDSHLLPVRYRLCN
jgi:hypothetical protein